MIPIKFKKSTGEIFKTELPLVLVHLGEELPLFLRLNILYLKKNYENLIVIADSQKVISKVTKLGINSYFYTGSQRLIDFLTTKLSHKKSFRNGFWFKAIIRFYALLDFMNQTSNNSLLHLESDVWISPNFPISKFSSLGQKLEIGRAHV